MNSNEESFRIKLALHLPGWDYEGGDTSVLKNTAKRIRPSAYIPDMEGALFCPVCFTNLHRVPKNKAVMSNGRKANFSHSRKFNNVKCPLRSTKPEGKRYETVEEAKQAIDNDELVVVSGFLQEKPEPRTSAVGDYNQSLIEDEEGELSEVAMGRHDGESFLVPGKVETVTGICRNFDENLYKYYFFPNNPYAVQLNDLLINIKNVTAVDDVSRLYFGRVIYSRNVGSEPYHIRMTELESNQRVVDFYLKISDEKSRDKGIDDNAVGKVVLIYGKIVASGVGLAIERMGYGEWGVLPPKYEAYLY